MRTTISTRGLTIAAAATFTRGFAAGAYAAQQTLLPYNVAKAAGSYVGVTPQ